MDATVAPLASIGVDIGKEVFHLVGFGTDGKIAFRRKIKRLWECGHSGARPKHRSQTYFVEHMPDLLGFFVR